MSKVLKRAQKLYNKSNYDMPDDYIRKEFICNSENKEFLWIKYIENYWKKYQLIRHIFLIQLLYLIR